MRELVALVLAPWALIGGLASLWRQHAAGGASGEHRSWGMPWATQSKLLVCSDQPLSRDVMASAVRELVLRHARRGSSVRASHTWQFRLVSSDLMPSACSSDVAARPWQFRRQSLAFKRARTPAAL